MCASEQRMDARFSFSVSMKKKQRLVWIFSERNRIWRRYMRMPDQTTFDGTQLG